MRAVIYTRLSKDRDGTATSTQRQERDCRRLCDDNGWDIVGVHVDSDFSGYRRNLHRPGFAAMLEQLAAGQADRLVVWKLDRLTRQPRQFEQVLDALNDAGARIVSVNDPADMTSPSGLAMLRVGMTFAAMESETISLRSKSALRALAERGEPHAGGRRPFGHTQDRRSLVEDEAELVREAADRVVRGDSLNEITRDWHDRGVRGSLGKPFRPATLRQMLLSPRLVGIRVHNGEQIVSEVIPAILEAGVWRQVTAVLADRGRPAGVGEGRSTLGGLVFCSVCGTAMKWKGRGGSDRPVYRCTRIPGTDACGSVVVSAWPLEDLIGAAVVDAVNTTKLGAVMTPGSSVELVAELEEARARWAQLDVDYAAGVTSRDGYLRAVALVRGEVERLEASVARHHASDLVAGLDAGESLADAWGSRGPAWRNALCRSVIRRVTVSPAVRRGSNRFDPGRVAVDWLE